MSGRESSEILIYLMVARKVTLHGRDESSSHGSLQLLLEVVYQFSFLLSTQRVLAHPLCLGPYRILGWIC